MRQDIYARLEKTFDEQLHVFQLKMRISQMEFL